MSRRSRRIRTNIIGSIVRPTKYGFRTLVNEIGNGQPTPPARPSTATTTPPRDINVMTKQAMDAGKNPLALLAALRARWEDADDRVWTDAELDEAAEILAGVD